MINLALLAVALIGYWAWKTRNAQALRFGDVTAAVAALIGMRLIDRHQMLPGLIAFAGAGWWLWFRKRGGGAEPAADGMSRDRARALLDLPRDATEDQIRAAHRRLIARVHPDAGGSTHLTAEINTARDILLATDVKR